MEYAGLSWSELAERSGISPTTIRRIVSTSEPRGFKSREEWEAIADACDVPRVFMELGFAPLEKPVSDTDRRVMEIERRLDEVIGAGARQGYTPAEMAARFAETGDAVEQLIARMDELQEQVRAATGPEARRDLLQEMIATTRAGKSAIAALLDEYAEQEILPAAGTRDEADANPESAPPLPEETPDVARRRAR